ncbi:MAG: helix-turn-helix transcriptional regulator [Ardenticatenaceae bacterium]|nr:helix-turn-helix transcriptional regulator [Ardenticatenaceae bacterium]
MMTRTRRELRREETEAEIKEVARRQMVEVGAAALSLRSIAREMGLTAPALYRYFPNRDALVTALIVEAYQSLAAAMIEAEAAQARDDFHGRFQSLAFAFRAWAVQYRQDFALIYGTPIPGYVAPREQTVSPASQVLQAIGTVLIAAWQAGRLTIPHSYQDIPPAMDTAVTDILQSLPAGVPLGGVVLTMTVWARLYGVVWGELFEHFPPGLAETGALYEMEVTAICVELGLR